MPNNATVPVAPVQPAVATDTKTTIITPTAADVATAAEVIAPVATTSTETVKTTTTTTPAVKAAPVVAKAAASYDEFFSQFVALVKSHQPKLQIKSINNCVKAMLADGSDRAFDTVLDDFSKNSGFVAPRVVLQEAASLPKPDRAVLETIVTVFHVMLNNEKADQKSKLDMTNVRVITKSDNFVSWCAKKFAA